MKKQLIFVAVMSAVALGLVGFPVVVSAGDPVPGLDITIEQIPGGVVKTAKTDKHGVFKFDKVKQGKYNFKIELDKARLTNYPAYIVSNTLFDSLISEVAISEATEKRAQGKTEYNISVTGVLTGELEPFQPIELTIGPKGGKITGQVVVEVGIGEEGVERTKKRPGRTKYEALTINLEAAKVKGEIMQLASGPQAGNVKLSPAQLKAVSDAVDDFFLRVKNFNSAKSNTSSIMKNAGVSDEKIEELLTRIDIGISEDGIQRVGQINEKEIIARAKGKIETIFPPDNLSSAQLKAVDSAVNDYILTAAAYNASMSNLKLIMKNAGVSERNYEVLEAILTRVEVGIKERRKYDMFLKIDSIKGEIMQLVTGSQAGNVKLSPAQLKAVSDAVGNYLVAAKIHNGSGSNVKLIMKNAGVSDEKIEELLTRIDIGISEDGIQRVGQINEKEIIARAKGKTKTIFPPDNLSSAQLKAVDDAVDHYILAAAACNAAMSNLKLIMKNTGVSERNYEALEAILTRVEVGIKEERKYAPFLKLGDLKGEIMQLVTGPQAGNVKLSPAQLKVVSDAVDNYLARAVKFNAVKSNTFSIMKYAGESAGTKAVSAAVANYLAAEANINTLNSNLKSIMKIAGVSAGNYAKIEKIVHPDNCFNPPCPWEEEVAVPKVREAADSSTPRTVALKIGRVGFKTTATAADKAKIKNFAAVNVVIREKSSKAIIARTKPNEAGIFKPIGVSIRRGLANIEIGYGLQGVEGFCYTPLPYMDSPPLQLMEECDPPMEELSILVLGPNWTCYNPPCPWEEEAAVPKVREAADSSTPRTVALKIGRVGFKTTATAADKAKIKNFAAVNVVIREKSSKAIIARTKPNEAGIFKPIEISIKGSLAGYEIGYGLQGVEGFCYEPLPYMDSPPLQLMEECDPPMEELSILVLGPNWTCYNPPCPWEAEEAKKEFAPPPTAAPTPTPVPPATARTTARTAPPTPTPMPVPTAPPATVPTPTPVPEPPDLQAQKFLNSVFTYGALGSFTVMVNNVGTGTATGPIFITDELPNGLAYHSFSDPYSSDWSCTASGQKVTCIYSGPAISPGGFLPTLIINVTISGIRDFPAATDRVVSCATVEHPSDRNPGNNRSCVTAVVTSR